MSVRVSFGLHGRLVGAALALGCAPGTLFREAAELGLAAAVAARQVSGGGGMVRRAGALGDSLPVVPSVLAPPVVSAAALVPLVEVVASCRNFSLVRAERLIVFQGVLVDGTPTREPGLLVDAASVRV